MFDEKIKIFLISLEEYWHVLNQRVSNKIPKTIDELRVMLSEHKQFEDELQVCSVR